MRIKRIPRALAHPYAPTLVTKPTETTPNAEAVPARPGADRHALDHKPPGYPRLLASARREPIEPAQWPPRPTIRGGYWIFAGHARRSRSDNLVTLTTEQHAALPYQGSGHWRPKMHLHL